MIRAEPHRDRTGLVAYRKEGIIRHFDVCIVVAVEGGGLTGIFKPIEGRRHGAEKRAVVTIAA